MRRDVWDETGARKYNGRATEDSRSDESIGGLLKRLSTDTADLIQQEILLARLEAQEIVQRLREAATRFAIAGALAIAGLLALTASAIIALGNAFGGQYGLSSLLVGVTVLVIAAVFGRRASARMQSDRLKPDQTVASLRSNARWARGEARALKHDLAGSNHN